MRIQTNPEDPYFRADARLRTVTFNRKIVPRHLLLEADDAKGLLVTLKAHDNGDIVLKDGDTIAVIQRGVVTISDPVVVRLPEEVPFQ